MLLNFQNLKNVKSSFSLTFLYHFFRLSYYFINHMHVYFYENFRFVFFRVSFHKPELNMITQLDHALLTSQTYLWTLWSQSTVWNVLKIWSRKVTNWLGCSYFNCAWFFFDVQKHWFLFDGIVTSRLLMQWLSRVWKSSQ